MSRVVIFANGKLPDANAAKAMLRRDDFLLGVDGGSLLIDELGFAPNLIIGDLDSITQPELNRFQAANVPIISYPKDKDETDMELAICHALGLKPNSIVIVAALGGRMDQTLANIALLADPALASVDVRLDDGVEEIFLCRSSCEIHGKAGDTVSLLPWQGEARGIITQNLQWKLNGETLFPHKTRGISNVMTDEICAVSIQSGLLLVIHKRLTAGH